MLPTEFHTQSPLKYTALMATNCPTVALECTKSLR